MGGRDYGKGPGAMASVGVEVGVIGHAAGAMASMGVVICEKENMYTYVGTPKLREEKVLYIQKCLFLSQFRSACSLLNLEREK